MRSLRRCFQVAFATAVVCSAVSNASAADFQFSTIIRAGLAGASDTELGIGATAGSPTSTGDVNPYFAPASAQLFEIGYLKATNTAYVRVYQNLSSSSAFSQVTHNPVGGGSQPANAIWRLPATSFFVRATNGSGINFASVSNLALSGVSGAINVLSPLQSTSMLAYQLGFASQSNVTQSQDVRFIADSGGNWRLTGQLQFIGLQSNGGVASGGDIQFGVTAALSETPEPASTGLAFLGIAGMVAYARKRSMRK